MIILNPNHIPLAYEPVDDLCEPHVGLSISQPVVLVKVHLARVIMEEGPEDRVGEPVVMPISELVREVDGVTVELFEKVVFDLLTVFHRDLRTSMHVVQYGRRGKKGGGGSKQNEMT